MKSKEPMLEPKRSDKAAAAYAEFMKGLSMVQQMEVNPSIFLELQSQIRFPHGILSAVECIKPRSRKSVTFTNMSLKPYFQPLDAHHTGGEVKGDSKEENAARAKRATWERIMKDREAAETTYRFWEKLKYRAQYFNTTSTDANNPLKKAGVNRSRKIIGSSLHQRSLKPTPTFLFIRQHAMQESEATAWPRFLA